MFVASVLNGVLCKQRAWKLSEKMSLFSGVVAWVPVKFFQGMIPLEM